VIAAASACISQIHHLPFIIMAGDKSLAIDKIAALNSEDLLPGVTAELAAFVAELTFDQIPPEVVSKAKELILDNIGVILFGNQTPWAKMIADMAEETGAAPRATILGHAVKTSAAQAALVNGTGGHSFEFDEIHRDGGMHPGSIIVPAVLALAESEGGCSGKDFITATVAAYEVVCRIGMSMGSGLFFRGHHPQGCTGVFAAAVGAAKILRLDAAATQNAMGITGSSAAGLMSAQEGAMVKRMHAGWAAQNGVYGALLARKGFTGIHNVLEASFGGYLSTFSDDPTPQKLKVGLGEQWETLQVGYKPYATVASIHTALEGLRIIMLEHSLTASDIEKIEVGVSKVTYFHCAWKYKPAGVTAAQMNLFYSMAVLATDGDAGQDQFREDRLQDSHLLDLIARMEARIDDSIEAKGRKFRHSAQVKVQTKDGRVFERTELYRRGSPENPARPGDIEEKFRQLAGTVLDEEDVVRLTHLLRNLDDAESLDELFSVLQGPKRP
jgi:2-methylcitrate dehydratase PrpD